MTMMIKNMIKANSKLVINFEVDYENCSYFQKKYMDSKDFQNNLITELINHKIKIIKREKPDHYLFIVFLFSFKFSKLDSCLGG